MEVAAFTRAPGFNKAGGGALSKLLTLPAQRIPKFLVLCACLVLVAGIGGPFSGKFEDAQENETGSFLPGDAESVAALKQIERSRRAQRFLEQIR